MKRSLKEVRKGLECGSCCPHRAWVVSPASSSLNPSFRVFMELLLHQSVQSLSLVWLSATPWTAARRASLSITNSWSLLKLVSIESVMPSCRCQLAKSIRSRERARWGWERKLKQEKSTTKMGSRGSDTSPWRDAVWHQLYSASHIYTEECEKDKTVNIFFVWPTHFTNSHKKSWEHGNGTLLLFLTPDNISLCMRSLHRTPGACSK